MARVGRGIVRAWKLARHRRPATSRAVIHNHGESVTRRQLFSFTFFSILLILIWQLGVILSPFFYPIVWAVIVAATFYPLNRKLLALLEHRRPLGAAVMTRMVMLIAVLPATRSRMARSM